ncbi:hypothetical protein [Pedobacter miscanthi]|nr:hypothetical protein [Pedobacter miscanthi]
MKLYIRQLFILLLISSGFSCYAAMSILKVPPPPKGCLKNGIMYTHYTHNVYDGYNPVDQTITGYRYIFGSDAVVCYANETLFLGPNPNAGGDVAIGCDVNKFTYADTTVNYSYNFTVIACPIDGEISFLILAVSTAAVLGIRKNK